MCRVCMCMRVYVSAYVYVLCATAGVLLCMCMCVCECVCKCCWSHLVGLKPIRQFRSQGRREISVNQNTVGRENIFVISRRDEN